MNWLPKISVALMLHLCVPLVVFAADTSNQSDSYRRLSEAVSKARQGTGIKPQTTAATGAPAVAVPAAGQAFQTPAQTDAPNDPQLTSLAKALSADQAKIANEQAAARQNAQQAAAVAPPPPQAKIEDEAFVQMTGVSLPLSPDKIRQLRRMFSRAQSAASEHPGTPPRPTSTSIMVNLSPGATPPVIRLSAGFVTSLVFVDGSGAPWPIASWDLGDPRSYNIQWDKKGGTNTLLIQAITEFNTGNLAVILKDLNTPIMLTLLPGQKAVDYRVDLRLPSLGPHGLTAINNLPPAENVILLNILNGVPPAGSQKLQVTGGDAEVWLIGDHLFARTRLTIVSPGWISTMSSADGLHAYEIQKTPLLLASLEGKMIKLVVEGL